MDQHSRANDSKADEKTGSLFDEDADGVPQRSTEISSARTHQSLFDDQFESKVSIWKSYREEKNEHEDLDDDLLNNPVLNSSPSESSCANKTLKDVPRINRFWGAGVQNEAGAVQEQPDGRQEARDTMDSTSHGASASDLAAIRPEILQKIMFEDEGSARKSIRERSTHPSMEEDLNFGGGAYESKRQRIGGASMLGSRVEMPKSPCQNSHSSMR
ncbi:uncharacterized protein VICG_01585, partial [Vittaforma corneae ATCC 50505]